MATRNIVPRANEEGNIGSSAKRWLKAWFKDLHITNVFTDGTNNITVAQIAAVTPDIGYAASEGESTTTALTWQQKLRLSFTPQYTGNYILFWSCEMTSATANKVHAMQVDQNDGTILASNQEVADAADGYYSRSGLARLALTAAQAQTFDMDYEGIAAQTTKIRKARLLIRRDS